ncbi:hypothetical protein [Kosakonia oryzendophytica]|uniref:hypothetical protein n=1 Tax=Kosakonia TaxID=1330547 RepID=UPI000776F37A|nr:hypothetical protein [Kosakonia oryzendophytica]AMO49436.1 Hypothetical protein AKI40_3051 [Enterobacter sp. FY-07]TDT59661.1 hypothetical protein DFO53_1250 [Enterobacter sp. AG5470]WBT56107.1 hypothetical protein O9K67_12940 [Kosakonia oryzendophytica]
MSSHGGAVREEELLVDELVQDLFLQMLTRELTAHAGKITQEINDNIGFNAAELLKKLSKKHSDLQREQEENNVQRQDDLLQEIQGIKQNTNALPDTMTGRLVPHVDRISQAIARGQQASASEAALLLDAIEQLKLAVVQQDEQQRMSTEQTAKTLTDIIATLAENAARTDTLQRSAKRNTGWFCVSAGLNLLLAVMVFALFRGWL